MRSFICYNIMRWTINEGNMVISSIDISINVEHIQMSFTTDKGFIKWVASLHLAGEKYSRFSCFNFQRIMANNMEIKSYICIVIK